MNDKSKLDIVSSNKESVIKISGAIDEDFSTDFVSAITSSKIVFDFEEVNLINSCGIREWIELVERIPEKEIVYRCCPRVLVEQINMVSGFLGANCYVESFYAPYYSGSADEEFDILLKAAEVGDDLKAPVKMCPKTSSEMEFDDIESQYFSFLKR